MKLVSMVLLASLCMPAIAVSQTASNFDTRRIETLTGITTLGRETKMRGASMGNAMGVDTRAAFAGSDVTSVVDGDFAMFEPELQNVLKALRAANIDIVAIHQDMSGEQPRVLFLHFWGIGKTVDLAKGIKAALDTQNH